MRLLLVSVVAALLIGLTACAAPAPAAAPTKEAVAEQPAEPDPETPDEQAARIAAELQAGVSSITAVEIINETNDPNELFGRPNGYTGGAVLTDSRATCTELGVSCGATVEIWPTEADAFARMDYIQGLLKDSPMLGSEYDYVIGTALLRVTGSLPPSVAAEYEAAFKG